MRKIDAPKVEVERDYKSTLAIGEAFAYLLVMVSITIIAIVFINK